MPTCPDHQQYAHSSYGTPCAAAQRKAERLADDLSDARRSLAVVTDAANAWAAACRALYNACHEGTRRGRPLDLIPKRDWHRIVMLIAAAESATEDMQS